MNSQNNKVGSLFERAISIIGAAARRIEWSFASFIIALLGLAFLYGFAVGKMEWFPYKVFKDSKITFLTIRHTFGEPRADALPDYSTVALVHPRIAEEPGLTKFGLNDYRAWRYRRTDAEAGNEPILFVGGAWQYLDYCPGEGCIAVVKSRDGKLIHAYPFRPDEYMQHAIVAKPYEEFFYNFARDTYPVGVVMLPDRGLIVTFQLRWQFPYGGGVARLDKDGHVLWFRRDYSHHWPTALSPNEIAVPSMRIGGSGFNVPITDATSLPIPCGGKYEDDTVQILDLSGHVKEEFSVLDSLTHSPYRAALMGESCDPVHLNMVQPLGPGLAASLPGSSPRDLLISMRNESAFVVVDRTSHKIKYFFNGTFFHQHAVQPFSGSQVILFDNWGRDPTYGGSRVLLYDVVTRREKTIFPTKLSGIGNLFTDTEGTIDISADRKRIFLSLGPRGTGFEISVADGRVLARTLNFHDLSSKPVDNDQAQHKALLFNIFGIYYAPNFGVLP